MKQRMRQLKARCVRASGGSQASDEPPLEGNNHQPVNKIGCYENTASPPLFIFVYLLTTSVRMPAGQRIKIREGRRRVASAGVTWGRLFLPCLILSFQQIFSFQYDTLDNLPGERRREGPGRPVSSLIPTFLPIVPIVFTKRLSIALF